MDTSLEREVANATHPEQFAIWAMRLWWRAFPELDAAWPDLVRGFRACGVPAAIESFHRFCSIALSAAVAGHGVGCLRCPLITPTEEKLLDVLAAAIDADVEVVEARLHQVVAASAARMAAPHAVSLARVLASSGLGLPRVAGPERSAPLYAGGAPNVSNRLH